MQEPNHNQESSGPNLSAATARLIAFYLPQFHPIPENDEWWSTGFTEWTNVARARPLFKGHHQPHLPADLGFYDLRVPEVRAAQARLAQDNGIEGFCYWHYWFAGKRLLERPFQEVLESGQPDFPFCLAWANESWTGVWNGQPDKVLLGQTYPGTDDYVRHFHSIVDAFFDKRYISVDDKPVFVIYQPDALPDPLRFTDLWNELAVKAGLSGIHFIGLVEKPWTGTPGFDGYTYHLPGTFLQSLPQRKLAALTKQLRGNSLQKYMPGHSALPLMVSYQELMSRALASIEFGPNHYPSVLPNWDSTPRHGAKGLVLLDSTPKNFRKHLREAISIVQSRPRDHRLVFLKSWNEWAEGNYLEPDSVYGTEYLTAIREECTNLDAPGSTQLENTTQTVGAI
jgi:lipopolysaccharide biosynthesis protein